MKSLISKTIQKTLLTLTLGLVTIGASEAHAFMVYPAVYVSPSQVEAQVSNSSGATIRCRVQVAGITVNGRWAHAWADMVLPPFGYEYAYVYSTYEPFVNGQASARCMVLGGY